MGVYDSGGGSSSFTSFDNVMADGATALPPPNMLWRQRHRNPYPVYEHT
jgi:hypothetical protein